MAQLHAWTSLAVAASSLLGILASTVACGEAGVIEVDPDPVPDTLAPGIEVRVTLAQEVAPVLAHLGWSEGVPGVTVRYARVDNGIYIWNQVTTDDRGRIFIGVLEPGDYWFAAERALTTAEKDGLPSPQESAGVLGGAPARLRVSSDNRTVVSTRLGLDHAGTLVISEVQMNTPESWDTGGTYLGGTFLELHNNSEDVIFLDGMILGMAYDWILEADHHSCPVTSEVRLDSIQLWGDVLWRFPGEGTDYPVPSDGTILVAASATDHRDVHTSLTDLRQADFELQGLFGGGADNPGVPNLHEVGPALLMQYGFNRHKAFWYLSEPVGDVGSLPSRADPGDTDREYLGIPREKVLDVAMIMTDNSGSSISSTYGKCDRGMAPVFDQLPGGYFTSPEKTVTVQRRVVTLLDGRRILLDTNTSGVDFVLAPQSPGWIPEG